MELIKPPETLEECNNILITILKTQGNPYCDHLMFQHLEEKRDEIPAKMKELNEN